MSGFASSFPDVEAILAEVLDASGITTATGTVTPPDLETVVAEDDDAAFARISRHGGGDNRVTDTARITIDTFASTRATAKAAAESIRDWLTARGGHVADGLGVIDSVTTDTGPFELPWGNPNIRRFTAAYRVSARR